jgi:hypothetical protein
MTRQPRTLLFSNVLLLGQESVPPIVFSSGALAELITDGVEGIVSGDKSADSLQPAIKQYLAHPDMARRHGVQAKASLTRLALNGYPLKWKDVYLRTMNTEPSRKPA